MRSEVAEEWGLVGEAHAGDVFSVLPDLEYDFDDIVDVTLRVNAAWDGEADKVHFCGAGEHQRADFDGADSAFQIKFAGQRDARKLIGGNVREKRASVEVDGVTARRLHDRHSLPGDVIAEISRRGDAVAQVIFFERLLHADGDGFKIAAGKPAVGRISLGEDEKVFFLLRENVVVGTEESADVGHAIFLGGHGASVAVGEHLLGNLFWRLVLKSLFAQLDEPGIFCEAASIEVERDAMALADRTDLADILHGDGLASTGVVGNGQHDERDALAAHAVNERFEGGDIHVAFERMRRGGPLAFFDDEIDGFGTDKFDVGASRIEVRVVGDDVALLAGAAEKDALGSASLMRGDDVPVAENLLDRSFEMIEALASGVAFVAFHHAGPLVGGHGSGAGVGEEVDEHIIGGKKKQIVVRGFEQFFALLAGSPANGFDAFDAEGFDDGLDGHGSGPDKLSYAGQVERGMPGD